MSGQVIVIYFVDEDEIRAIEAVVAIPEGTEPIDAFDKWVAIDAARATKEEGENVNPEEHREQFGWELIAVTNL